MDAAWTLGIAAACAGMALAVGQSSPAADSGPGVEFARDIQPVLAARCIGCHGPSRQEGGLRLDLRRRALEGGDHGAGIVAGKSAESEVFLRLVSEDPRLRMPLGAAPLTPAEIARIRAWIDRGAVWPDQLAGSEEASPHWAFQPVRRPEPPEVKARGRARNPIDAFVLARLEPRGLTLSPDATPHTLVRRLHLDLLGLPPAPEAVDEFVNDASPDAYERLIDTLLASPHFGERWGRHWLDLARFGESDGYENDLLRPNAWRFRDWVIDAVNRDLPFDRFTLEQLAGDLLPDATPEQRIAAGFHRNTLWNSAASADKEEFRTFAVKDRTDTTGTVWMGLTLGCAKCHSHKYDPLTQREYYGLYAFFNNTDHEEAPLPGGGTAPTLKAVQRPTHVHRRGSFLDPGAEVRPHTPAFLPALQAGGEIPDRLDLARWLVDPQHPLTARVTVNRFWQHLFGEGLVPTPENFGISGLPPTHPELLDWLASELVQGGWSRKALLKTILLSSTYRQASHHRPHPASVDPGNALLARQNRVRVEAEIVYDLALAVSGLLDPRLGGPSIVPAFPEGILEQRFADEALKRPTAEKHRRGVYIHLQRTLSHPLLSTFDAVDGNQTCVRRERTITPLQALALLNDPNFEECVRALGKRLYEAAPDRDSRLVFGYRLCLAREPAPEELAVLVELVETQRKLGADEPAIWVGVARTLLNLEEFITRE
jgi:mono/diheme cytochrome c family protein